MAALPLDDHGWRLRKITRNSSRKIDGAIAAVMAVHQALQPVPTANVGAFLAHKVVDPTCLGPKT